LQRARVRKTKRNSRKKGKNIQRGCEYAAPHTTQKAKAHPMHRKESKKNSQIKSKPRKKLPPAKNKHKPNTITELGKRY